MKQWHLSVTLFLVLMGFLASPTGPKSTIPIEDLEKNLEALWAAHAPEKVYLHLDRSMYNPGEDIWFAGYLREAATLKESPQSDILHVELINPKGITMNSQMLLVTDGNIKGDFNIPKDAPGGIYKIKAYSNWQKNEGVIFEREITVHKPVLPNLKMKLKFERKAFSPGEEVVARLDLHDLSNKPLTTHDFSIDVSLNGVSHLQESFQTDQKGRTYIRFKLPANLDSSDGLLNVRIPYQGNQESISRSIPITLGNIDLQFFPEGGDAIAGLPQKVAFKALNEFGKPTDVQGVVYNQNHREIVRFSSLHDGMGTFHFQPKEGHSYYAKLEKPDTEKKFVLPDVKPDGVVLEVKKVHANRVDIEIHTRKVRNVHIVAHKGDKIFYSEPHYLLYQKAGFSIPTNTEGIGISKITIFDEDAKPMAERLVFINKDKTLQVDIQTPKEQYLPREKVSARVKVKDHKGNPVQGAFSLAVVDDNQRTFADDKQGHILSSLLLESELKGEIVEPNFYFDDQEEKADAAMDLLMLTHGWRRFSWDQVLEKKPAILAHHPEKAVIAGQLLTYNNQPLEGRKVVLYPQNIECETDEKGAFSFDRVKLAHNAQLYLKQQRDLTLLTQLHGYVTSLQLMVYPKDLNGYYMPGKTGVSGVVFDEQAGEPLIGAHIIAKQKESVVGACLTDFDGKYELNLPAGDYDLSFEYVGYRQSERKSVRVEEEKSFLLHANLNADVLLEEVVVASGKIKSLRTEKLTNVAATTAGIKNQKGRRKRRGARDNKVAPPAPAAVDMINAVPVEDEIFEMEDEILMDDMDLGLVGADDIEMKDQKLEEPRMLADIDGAGEAFKEMRQFAKKKMPVQQFKIYQAREFYAPKYKVKDKNPAVRNDFRSTLYWNPAVRLDNKGEASLEFFTSDDISSFRIITEGLSYGGSLGRAEKVFFTQLPFSMRVKAPVQTVVGDIIGIPVTMVNNTNEPLDGTLSHTVGESLKSLGQTEKHISLRAQEAKTIYLEYQVLAANAQNDLKVAFSANRQSDQFQASIPSIEKGFPVEKVYASEEMHGQFSIPLNMPVQESISLKFKAYPSIMDDVMTGMERMLRQPGGCFEQTSSSNYPNLLVLDYLKSAGEINQGLENKAMGYLSSGYDRLKGFEINGGGFEWFGRPPAHEALSAYGLMEFVDMQTVFPVEQALIDRTAKWLLSRKDGKGSWQYSGRGLHSWLGQSGVRDAYICWALAEAGFGDKIAKEIDHALTQAQQSEDSYQLALMANVLWLTKDTRANKVLNGLIDRQTKEQHWMGKDMSVTQSRGNALTIETTALTALAMMKAGHKEHLPAAIQFLMKSKSPYGYGNTQSTVLALKALVEYAKSSKRTKSSGQIAVSVNGRPAGSLMYKADHDGSLEITGLEKYLKEGDNDVEVVFEKTKEALPYDLSLEYRTRKPQDGKQLPLTLQTHLQSNKAQVGENVRLETRLTNESGRVVGSPLVKLGIPAGLSVQPWQLKELQDKEVFAYYEWFGEYVVLYFDSMADGQQIEVNLDLKVEMTGEFEAPASVCYPYYENEMQDWATPTHISVHL